MVVLVDRLREVDERHQDIAARVAEYKRIFEEERAKNPLLDRIINARNGSTSLMHSFGQIDQKFGGARAFIPSWSTQEDKAVIEQLDRIIGYLGKSDPRYSAFLSDNSENVLLNSAGFGAASVVACTLVSLLDLDPQNRELGRREFFKEVRSKIASGVVLGGGFGTLLGTGSSYGRLSDLKDARGSANYVAERIYMAYGR